ncbi:MAG: metallophosphoesterase [Pikeienuella sp.]
MSRFSNIRRIVTSAACVFGISAFSAAVPSAAITDSSFSFVVIGDTPYNDDDQKMLDTAVAKLKIDRPPFVIHVGDYKKGKAPCDDEYDEKFKKLIDDITSASIPVVYTPGDNEWADCDRTDFNDPSPAPVSELGRLEHLRTNFLIRREKPNLTMFKPQTEVPGGEGLVENSMWQHQGVRFATLHVVDGNGRNYVNYYKDSLDRAAKTADERDRANLGWLAQTFEAATIAEDKAVVISMQADPIQVDANFIGTDCESKASKYVNECDLFVNLRRAIREHSISFKGHVLLVHGDTYPFCMSKWFLDGGAPNLWRLNVAGDLRKPADVTLVSFNPDPTNGPPFSASGYLNGTELDTNNPLCK